MALPPRLLQLLAALLFLSVLLHLVSGVHGARRHRQQADDGDGAGEHHLGMIGDAVARWWSRTVVRRGGGGGHGHGHGRGHGRGRGHGEPGTPPAVFNPRTVVAGHHRGSAAASALAARALQLVVAAATVAPLLLLRL